MASVSELPDEAQLFSRIVGVGRTAEALFLPDSFYHLPVTGYPIRNPHSAEFCPFSPIGLSPKKLMTGGGMEDGMVWSAWHLLPDAENQKRLCILVWIRQENEWKLAMSRGLFSENGERAYRFNPETRQEAVELEREFCRQASRQGIAKAFFDHMAPGGGAAGSGDLLEDRDDYRRKITAAGSPSSAPRLLWEAEYSLLSRSGRFLVNSGPYMLSSVSEPNSQTASFGFFFSIWERQADGSWRFLLDAGNTSPALDPNVFIQ